MIVLKHVTKSYRSRTAVADASVRIDPQECVCVVGPGGSGKSTLLKLLTGEEKPTTGSVEVDGVDLRTLPPAILQLYRQRLGIVFQDPRLLEHLSIAENVALPLEVAGASAAEMNARTVDILTHLGLLERAKAKPKSLSESEKRLTALARALVRSPSILLADDPLSGLDAAQSAHVLDAFKDLHKAGATVLLLLRDAAPAKTLGARVIHMEAGKIVREKQADRAFEPVTAEHEHRILEPVLPPDEPDHAAVHIAPAGHAKDAPAKHAKAPQRKIRITAISSDA